MKENRFLNPARKSVALMFRKTLAVVLVYSFLATSMWSLTQPGQGLPGRNSVSLASGKALLPYLAFSSLLSRATKPGSTPGGMHNAAFLHDTASPAPIIYSNIDELKAAQLADDDDHGVPGNCSVHPAIARSDDDDDDDHEHDGDREYHHHSYHYDDDGDHHPPAIVATGFTFFGPQSYVRTTGQPNQFTSTFTVPAWITQPFFLHVENGDVEKNHRDSSATVALNGTTILGPSAFNEHVGSIDCSVNLATQSTLHVTLASKPGSFLKISVLGKDADHTPPAIAVTAPLPGSSVNTTTPHLAVSYNDLRGTGEPAASGINTSTLAIMLDGVDRTSIFTRRPTDASADLPSSLALAAGPHTITASIKDNAGNVAQASSQFQVDSAPLSLQIVQPTAGAYLNTTTPQIQLTYNRSVVVATSTLLVLINGIDRSSLFTKTTTGASAVLTAATALPQGANQIVATIRDQAGNQASATTAFNVDTTPPVIAVVHPLSASKHGSSTIEYSVQFSDDQAIDTNSLQLAVDGNALPFTLAPGLATGTTILLDGSHTLTASIKDKAGNQGAASSTFSVDTTAPDIHIVQPAPGAILNTSSTPVQVQYGDGQNVDVNSFKVTLDGADKTALFTVGATSASAVFQGPISDGQHTIAAQIADPTGNIGHASSSFLIDTIKPQLTIVSPSGPVNSATPSALAQYSDSGSGIDTASVRVFFDGSDVTSSFSVGSNSAAGAPAANLSEGQHQFRARVSDRAGNVTEATSSFLVDITAPTAAFSTPANNSFINNTRPTLTLNYADAGSGINTGAIHIFLQQGSAPETEITSIFTLGAAQGVGTISASAPLAPGTYHLRAQVADRAGNATTATSAFQVDTEAPTYVIQTPAANSFLNTATPTFLVTYQDDSSGVDPAQFALRVDGIDRTNRMTATALRATGTLPAGEALAEGTHQVEVTVVDQAGNQAPVAPQSFLVDTILPSLNVSVGTSGVVNNSHVPITVFYADSGSGIDVTTFHLSVDGVDHTAEFTAGPTGASGSLATALADGSHSITTTIADLAGNVSTTTVPFVLSTTAPQITISQPADGSFTNAASVVVAGSVTSILPVTVTVDGVSVPLQGGTFTSPAIALGAEGARPIPVVATDAAGNSSTATVTVNVDRTPPTVTGSVAPTPTAAGWNNTDVTVTFVCSDAGSGVASCSGPVQFSTEGANQVATGNATDRAGNTAQTTVKVSIDKTAPTISANAAPPPNAAGWNNTDVVISYQCSDSLSGVAVCPSPATASAEGSAEKISAQVVDKAGNTATVISSLNIDKTGPVISAVSDPPANAAGWNKSNVTVSFSCTDSLSGVASCPSPTVVATEGQNQPVNAQATDIAGNTSTGGTVISIDKTAPSIVQLSTPDHISSLHGGVVSAIVNDNFTVAQVVISVNGTQLGSFSSPPYQVNLQVPTGANPGDTLTVTAQATDQAGNTQTSQRGVRVSANGVVVGQVLSDTTSFPIQGASVQLIGTTTLNDQTDDHGRYSLQVTDSHVFLVASSSSPATTTVEREVFVAQGVGTVPVDARLTPLAAPVSINSGNGTLTSGNVTVTVPAGSVVTGTTFQLTPLSGQGLPGLLPLGWSPLAAFDLRSSSSATSLSASIAQLPNVVSHLVSYNQALHAWTVVAQNLHPVGGIISVPLPTTGGYALVVPDTFDPPIPTPDIGAALTGVAVQLIAPDATSSGSLSPAIVPPSGGTSTATLGVQSSTYVPSGTVIQANIAESFSLKSGSVVSQENRSEDVVLYNALAPAGASMGAKFPVTPTPKFSNTELLSGKVHLDILAGREGVRGQPGGSDPLVLSDGTSTLSVPGGALNEDTAISIESVGFEDFVPASGSLGPLQEVLVDFSGETLNTPAQLSISAIGLNPTDTFLLTKVQRLDGIPRMVLVALAQVNGDRLTSVSSTGLPGIVEGGEYVFYDVSAASGFVQGVVSTSAGPVAALVQTDSFPIVSITGSNGQYVVPALTGTVNLNASVPHTALAGSATTQLVAAQTVPLNITLSGVLASAVVSPADGALGVPSSTVVTITTTAPLNPQSIQQSNLKLFKGTPASGQPVLLQPFVLSASGMVLAFAPVGNLDPATQYTIQVSGLADVFGGAVTVPASTFTTKAVAPITFDPSQIVFAFPDQNGIIHVSAPAGALPPGTRVQIVDLGNGVVLSITAFNDGSVSGDFMGTINDVLQITVTDPNGATASFTKSQFVAPDGSVAVGPGGGTVTGTGGVELRIPNGTFDKAVKFQIQSFGATEFPDQPPLPGANFGAGMRITVDQIPTFKSEVKLAFAKPADAPPDAFYYVYRRLHGPNGLVAYETLDHAFVEGQGATAKVVTASPPFPGYSTNYGTVDLSPAGGVILGGALITDLILAWTINPAGPGIPLPGVVTGRVLRPKFVPGKTDPVFEGVPGVAVTAADSSGRPIINFGLGTSQSDGTFVLWAPFFHGGSTVDIQACDPVLGTCRHEIAAEVVVADTNTVLNSAGPLLKFYRNVAAANITFQQLPPTQPPPQLQLSLFQPSTGGGLVPANGPFLTNSTIVVKATSNVNGANGVVQITGATLQGQSYGTRANPQDPQSVFLDPDLTPTQPGLYRVTATALPPLGGAPVTASLSFLVIGAGGSNSTVLNNQPPDIITAQSTPKDKAKGVPITIFPQVVFSEPVTNVASNVRLLETDSGGTSNGSSVAIKISGLGVSIGTGGSTNFPIENVSDSDSVVSITIQPVGDLKFNTYYKVSLGHGIVDLDKDSSGNPAPKNLALTPPNREFSFQTFGPTEIASTGSFASPRVVVMGDRAYVANPISTITQILEYDVSDPIHPQTASAAGATAYVLGRVADLAGQEAMPDDVGGSVLAVGTGAGVPAMPSNIFFFDVSNPDKVTRVGAVSVTGSAYQEGTILRMAMKDDFVYTSTFQKGIQVVDIRQAISNYKQAAADPRLYQQFGFQVTQDGEGFGRDAVVNTIPVMTTAFTPTPSNASLFGIAAAGIPLDQQTQTVVAATGVESLVIADPVAGQVLFQQTHLNTPAGTMLRGFGVALGTLNVPCPSGSASGVTNCSVAVVTGSTAADSILAVVDLTDPRNPTVIGGMVLDEFGTDVILKDNLAIVGESSKAQLVDLGDPSRPQSAGEVIGAGGRLTFNGFLFSTGFGSGQAGLHITALGALAFVKSFEPKVIVVSSANELFDNVRINYGIIPPDPDITAAEVHIDVQPGGSRAATLPGSVTSGSGSVIWPSGAVVQPSKNYLATVHANSNGAEIPTVATRVPLLGVPIAVAPRDKMLRIQFALPDQAQFLDAAGQPIDKYTVKVYLNADGTGTPALTVTSTDIANAYPNTDVWFNSPQDNTTPIQDGTTPATQRWVARKIDQVVKGAGLNSKIKMQAFEVGTVLASYTSIYVAVVSEKTGDLVAKLTAATSQDDNWNQIEQNVATQVDKDPNPSSTDGVMDNAGMIFRVLHAFDQAGQNFAISVLKGLLEGFKDGAEGDLQLVGSVFDAIRHPVKTAIGLYQFVGKVIQSLGQLSFSSIFKAMYNGAGSLSWPSLDDVVLLAGKAGYFFGYLAGFILEQLLSAFILAVVGAGVGALAEKVLAVLKGVDWIANLAKDAAVILRVVGYWFEVLAKAGADSKVAKTVLAFMRDSREALVALTEKYPGADKVLKKLAETWETSATFASKGFEWLNTINKMSEEAAERFVAFLNEKGESLSNQLVDRWLSLPNGKRAIKDAAESYDGFAKLSSPAADALTTGVERVDSDLINYGKGYADKLKNSSTGDRVESSLRRLRPIVGDTTYTDEAIGNAIKRNADTAVVEMSDDAIEETAAIESHVSCTIVATLAPYSMPVPSPCGKTVLDDWYSTLGKDPVLGPRLKAGLEKLRALKDPELEKALANLAGAAKVDSDAYASLVRAISSDSWTPQAASEWIKSVDAMRDPGGAIKTGLLDQSGGAGSGASVNVKRVGNTGDTPSLTLGDGYEPVAIKRMIDAGTYRSLRGETVSVALGDVKEFGTKIDTTGLPLVPPRSTIEADISLKNAFVDAKNTLGGGVPSIDADQLVAVKEALKANPPLIPEAWYLGSADFSASLQATVDSYNAEIRATRLANGLPAPTSDPIKLFNTGPFR